MISFVLPMFAILFSQVAVGESELPVITSEAPPRLVSAPKNPGREIFASRKLPLSAIKEGAKFVVFHRDLVLEDGRKARSYEGRRYQGKVTGGLNLFESPVLMYKFGNLDLEPSQFKQTFPIGTTFNVDKREILYSRKSWYKNKVSEFANGVVQISLNQRMVRLSTWVRFSVTSSNKKQYIFESKVVSNTDWADYGPEYPDAEECGTVADWSGLLSDDAWIAIWLLP